MQLSSVAKAVGNINAIRRMGYTRVCRLNIDISPSELATLQRLARLEHVTVSNYVRRCINAALAESGIEPLPETDIRPRLTKEQIATALRLHAAGLNLPQIADRLGCSLAQANYACSERRTKGLR